MADETETPTVGTTVALDDATPDAPETPTRPPVRELQPTSAAAFAGRWQQTYVRELSPGFAVRLRKLPLTGELLRGTLPNQVLRRIRFEQQPFMDDRTEVERQRDNYEAALPILSRAMVEPKFVFNREPNIEKGEIGPDDLSYVELDNCYFYVVKEVVPPTETSPFRANGDGSAGADQPVQPGEGVRAKTA